MTMPVSFLRKCSVCGTESIQTGLASTNRFGSPDLDLRPPEMMRSTMHWWIQECPCCGYIASDISEPTNVDIEWLKLEHFPAGTDKGFQSDLAHKFYKYYLTNLADHKQEDAFDAAQHAAWSCDDAGDRDNAIICRKAALASYPHPLPPEDNDALYVVRADLMRRAELFDDLIDEYSRVRFSEEILNQVMAFQIEKAKEHDTGCYTVEDAVSPPKKQ
ncbi:MAG: hypothetical protein IKO22_08080 [Oscillospiraceae bacterium]|nr:hypothetical protein [Oscillospiraceae bacterium]